MNTPRIAWLLPGLILSVPVFAVESIDRAVVLTNQVGYEFLGPKRAILREVESHSWTEFEVKSYPERKPVVTVPLTRGEKVDHWRNWTFWALDFDSVQTEGWFVIECHGDNTQIESAPFRVQQNVLERGTLNDVVFYFKGQRSSGALDHADQHMTFLDSDRPAVDVHGGWMDASGDYGKHLSHLAYSTFHNPQQIPFVVYSLLKSYDRLEADVNFTQDRRRILDEALFGADYLVRVKAPGGSFYETISNRGPAKKAEDRRITPAQRLTAGVPPQFEVSFRGGGGMAIAALALASHYPAEGEFTPAQYLKAAEDAFAFLAAHNNERTNDGHDNIVDDYCALAAATELYRTTQKAVYAEAAKQRAESLLARLISTGGPVDYWRADDGTRPFFHAADAGLPVVALVYYHELADEPMRQKIAATIRRELTAELKLTNEVPNPFRLARQYVQNKAGERRTTFFYPHDSDSAPWWQGENARLGSLAAAARLAKPLFKGDPTFQMQLEAYATSQLDWILGLNPFDACMLDGSGRNNPEYIFKGTYQYRNQPGGICNGITAADDDPHGIAFDWTPSPTGEDIEWRWGEQWLPHDAWYLLAVAAHQPMPK